VTKHSASKQTGTELKKNKKRKIVSYTLLCWILLQQILNLLSNHLRRDND